MTIRLSFHGAAGDVTGSCHLLEAGGKRILVDCGLFQSSHGRDHRNTDDFGFDPASIDILLLTHAHLDHCGRIPLLVKRGFRGEIITTAATRDLAQLMLLDAAHIEEEEWDRDTRQSWHRGKASTGPLFTVHDATRAFDFFGRIAVIDTRVELGSNLRVRFKQAGHILGSAFLVIDAGQETERRRIVFSGDLGAYGRSILPDPASPPEADYVIMETTYGDRRHKGLTDPSRFTMNLSAMKCSASPMSTGTRNPTTRRWLPSLLILQNESPLAKLPEHTSKFTRQALSMNVDGCAEPLSYCTGKSCSRLRAWASCCGVICEVTPSRVSLAMSLPFDAATLSQNHASTRSWLTPSP